MHLFCFLRFVLNLGAHHDGTSQRVLYFSGAIKGHVPNRPSAQQPPSCLQSQLDQDGRAWFDQVYGHPCVGIAALRKSRLNEAVKQQSFPSIYHIFSAYLAYLEHKSASSAESTRPSASIPSNSSQPHPNASSTVQTPPSCPTSQDSIVSSILAHAAAINSIFSSHQHHIRKSLRAVIDHLDAQSLLTDSQRRQLLDYALQHHISQVSPVIRQTASVTVTYLSKDYSQARLELLQQLDTRMFVPATTAATVTANASSSTFMTGDNLTGSTPSITQPNATPTDELEVMRQRHASRDQPPQLAYVPAFHPRYPARQDAPDLSQAGKAGCLQEEADANIAPEWDLLRQHQDDQASPESSRLRSLSASEPEWLGSPTSACDPFRSDQDEIGDLGWEDKDSASELSNEYETRSDDSDPQRASASEHVAQGWQGHDPIASDTNVTQVTHGLSTTPPAPDAVEATRQRQPTCASPEKVKQKKGSNNYRQKLQAFSQPKEPGSNRFTPRQSRATRSRSRS